MSFSKVLRNFTPVFGMIAMVALLLVMAFLVMKSVAIHTYSEQEKTASETEKREDMAPETSIGAYSPPERYTEIAREEFLKRLRDGGQIENRLLGSGDFTSRDFAGGELRLAEQSSVIHLKLPPSATLSLPALNAEKGLHFAYLPLDLKRLEMVGLRSGGNVHVGMVGASRGVMLDGARVDGGFTLSGVKTSLVSVTSADATSLIIARVRPYSETSRHNVVDLRDTVVREKLVLRDVEADTIDLRQVKLEGELDLSGLDPEFVHRIRCSEKAAERISCAAPRIPLVY